jgi:hypothetical protein
MTPEEMYKTAKETQDNLGTASAGQIALAKLLTALETIDFEDLNYRFYESEIMEFINYVAVKDIK